MTNRPSQREFWSGKAGDEWTALADRLDAMMQPIADAALSAGAFKAGERVLDIGCGSGATSLEIAKRVGATGAVTGIDLSPQLLALARERAQGAANVTFTEADASAARFDPIYDAAFSRFGVMFFEDPTAAFANIRTALKPNGRLAFICWRAQADNEWASMPLETIKPMLKAPLPSPDPEAPGPQSFADPERVRRILDGAGWRDVAIQAWDGVLRVGGGGSVEDAANFVLRVGPCSRAIEDQALDKEEARRRLTEALAVLYRDGAVHFDAGCWIVTARA